MQQADNSPGPELALSLRFVVLSLFYPAPPLSPLSYKNRIQFASDLFNVLNAERVLSLAEPSRNTHNTKVSRT